MKAQLLSGIARASGRALNTLNNRSLHVRSAQRMGGCAPIGEVTLADQAQASAGRPGETMAFRCCFAVYHPHRSVSSTLPISRHISIRSLHAAPRPKFVRAASGSQDPRGPESSAQSGLVGRVAGGLAIFLAGSIALASPALAKPFGSPFTEPPVYVAPEVSAKPSDARMGDLAPDERSTVELFERCKESVVNITSIATVQDSFTLNIFQIPAGQGSGFVWDDKGHVVTNYHVVKGASGLTVTMLDQSVFKATVIGTDPTKDIAVLQLQGNSKQLAALSPIRTGTSADLLVGQRVLAIGNPFGLDHTLTQGIISGIGREIPNASGVPIRQAVQTDAAINPGNSGGPLLDRLIGVNTAILDPSGKGSYSGVGFAIPVDTVKSVVGQIIEYGRVQRPTLGVRVAPDTLIARIGIKGVYPLDVDPSGPAGKADIRPSYRDGSGRLVIGDIIVGVDGKPVANLTDLYRALDDCKVGQTVKVDLLRVGPSGKPSELSVNVKLADRAEPLILE